MMVISGTFSASAQANPEMGANRFAIRSQESAVRANLVPLGINLLQDPSFEASLFSMQYWQQFSTHWNTPLFPADGGAWNGAPRTGFV